MLIHIRTCAVALICCLAVSPAFADYESSNSSLIFSGGYSKAKNACDSPWVTVAMAPGGTCRETHTALRLAYNYRFTPIWGFEASYGDLGNATGEGISTVSATSGSLATWSTKAMGWAFAGTATVPITGAFSFFGKVGTVRAEFSESYHANSNTTGAVMQGISINGAPISRQIKNAVTYGAGVQYELNKDFAIRAQYENFGSYDIYSAYGVSNPPRISLSMISAGIVLKF
ncbi:OmpA-like transmembrane domain protein [mine drainage metagenome]|uniref:OmpA-like transmembrane domain protein n=1 Tax=mine drainage metagenome TaxID=410659 RepID=A0A1J5TE73_9ZZZZ